MLTLTRRINETIVIGEEVFITVLGVKGNQVRLGIHAPRDTPVHRQEIHLKIKENEEQGIVYIKPNLLPNNNNVPRH
jgi:carbon storage regulator